MAGWGEKEIRAAASWQAFKEGQTLLAGGKVLAAERTADGWKASVSAGRRPFQVAVKVKSATHLEARCACPDFQRSGAFCAHAVAGGLAVLMGGARPGVEKPVAKPAPKVSPQAAAAVAPVKAAETPPPTVICVSLHWMKGWEEALDSGRLPLRIERSRRESPTPADERVGRWAEMILGPGWRRKLPEALVLRAGLLGSFLEAAVEHPEGIDAATGKAITLDSGARLTLESAELVEEAGATSLVFEPAAEDEILEFPGAIWLRGGRTLARLALDPLPASARPVVLALASGASARIAPEAFLENSDAWSALLDWPEGSWPDRLRVFPAPCLTRLRLDGNADALDAFLEFVYADLPPVAPHVPGPPGLPRLEGDVCLTRHLALEDTRGRALLEAGFAPLDLHGRFRLSGAAAVRGFLVDRLPKLMVNADEWEIERSAAVEKLADSIVHVKPSFQMLDRGDDFIRFNLAFETDAGKEIPASEVQRMLRGGGAAGGRPGRTVEIDPDYEALYEPLLAELDVRQVGGAYEAGPAAAEVLQEILGKSARTIADQVDLPNSVTAKLRPYQAVGTNWMIDRLKRFGGGLLADDMGLGKTLQTIVTIERWFEFERVKPKASDLTAQGVLVVAPTSLLGNWSGEWAKFAPNRRIHVMHGPKRDALRSRIGPEDVVLTSFSTLPRDLAFHLRQEYLAVVVDEASLMRNPDTDHAKALVKLHSPARIALSGTPVENSVRDLWSIFRFVQPGWLGTREQFKDRYQLPLLEGPAAAAGPLRRLRLLTAPFILRRTKEEVAPDLPPRIYIEEYCELTSDQKTVYNQLVNEGKRLVDADGDGPQGRMRMLTALLRLRQTCCDLALLGNETLAKLPETRRSSKLARLLELLEELHAGGHRVLIFSQFQQQLVAIERSLESIGLASLRLDGQTRDRQALVDRFQRPDGPPVFLISLKAGGYGLTLTAADTVIHFDPWWNPAAERQATDRAHRIGQTLPVTVIRMLTRGTVEEQVLRMQEKKIALATAIDEGGIGDAAGWQDDELRNLLGGGRV